MGAPYLWIGVWDPDRTDDELSAACAASFERRGARVVPKITEDGRRVIRISHYEALCPPGDYLLVEPGREDAGPGGLVQIVVPIDYFEEPPRLKPAKAWARMRTALERLLTDVRPLLMVCPVELSVDLVPDPPEELSELLFNVGWVDPQRLDERQRRAFDEALLLGPRADVAGGWWWSGDPNLEAEGRTADDPRSLARAVYGAWTRRPAPGPDTREEWPDDLPTAQPELWFWAAERTDEALEADIARWGGDEGVPPERIGVGTNGEPGWFPVVVELDPDGGVTVGINLLRRAVASVRLSWGAFLPESGIAVPGLTPEIPSTGVLPNVWVSDGWLVGEARAEVEAALDGAHREELEGGVLLVTDPEVLPDGDFAGWCYDPAARGDRLVDAASILARTARASRRPS
ncbi:MAG: hypothetical protein ACRDZ3_05145 [Acidimicrobiia bacterium]